MIRSYPLSLNPSEVYWKARHRALLLVGLLRKALHIVEGSVEHSINHEDIFSKQVSDDASLPMGSAFFGGGECLQPNYLHSINHLGFYLRNQSHILSGAKQSNRHRYLSTYPESPSSLILEGWRGHLTSLATHISPPASPVATRK